jgi:hypothetical protein
MYQELIPAYVESGLGGLLEIEEFECVENAM